MSTLSAEYDAITRGVQQVREAAFPGTRTDLEPCITCGRSARPNLEAVRVMPQLVTAWLALGRAVAEETEAALPVRTEADPLVLSSRQALALIPREWIHWDLVTPALVPSDAERLGRHASEEYLSYLLSRVPRRWVVAQWWDRYVGGVSDAR